ncbi:MAG: hypothetical protein CBC62_08435 [Opitutia bacterium TMED102]|nr:MAG: hypothetical protein CBC62_08435 [Opitutae bacterium TMED102]
MEPSLLQEDFRREVQPQLAKYCYGCHGEKKAKAGIRVDYLDGSVPDKEVRHWEIIRKQLLDEEMPPEDEDQLSEEQREVIVKWIDEALLMARSRVRPKNGGARRLTVAQYRNTLRDLLGVVEELTGVLPPDGVSKDGFVNNGQEMLLSPLLLESYFDIAERALDLTIVNENTKPKIQAFRVELGEGINAEPYPDKLILGANSHLLPSNSFVVSQPLPDKPFDFSPFEMRTKWRFNEGYQGNSTVRGWRDYDSIYHAVFACMRGTGGYPLGKAYELAPDGLLLRASIPSAEVWQVSSTYGPYANFKISLRELPKHGQFRVRVKAAKYEDALLLPNGSKTAKPSESALTVTGLAKRQKVNVSEAGIYQVDVHLQTSIGQEVVADASSLAENLLGFWGMDGNTDSLPKRKGLTGELVGDAKFVKSPIGNAGQAVSLDGNGDAVVVPRDKLMDVGAGEFTVSAWIRPTELRQAGIVVLGGYGWTHGWVFDMPNNKGVIRLETSNAMNQANGTVTSRAGVIRRNQWQHVAAIVRRGENKTRLYVNGYEVGVGSVGASGLGNPEVNLTIGRVPEAQQFKGEIDEVRYYSRALGEAELKALLVPGQRFVKAPPEKQEDLKIKIAGREFEAKRRQAAFALLRLPIGLTELSVNHAGGTPHRVVLTPIPADSELAKRFERFEKRSPWLGVHLGLRRDCGSTFSPVQRPVEVAGTALREFVFEGAINNYPSDDVQEDNDNYLAGVREIGVRSEYTDGRDRPRLRVRSVEFEGPFYESWPPATHRRIFIGSANEDKPEVYAREIVRKFAGRAYRRPVAEAEASSLMAVWRSAFAEHGDFTQSIKDTLLIVLTSPQFLFLIEESTTPKAEPLAEHELASKLAYFLWNTVPDPRLRQLADAGKLRAALDTEITRLIRDERFGQFADEFASQWLSLEKFDVVEMDRNKYPTLTRDVRLNLRREPVELLQYLVRENLPARHLVQSDFILANEVTASYYGLGNQTERGFDFAPVAHRRPHLGGLLAQTSILAGLSDGREANAVKRGAWLARKIIAEPPADPPPNVPGIEEIDPKLSLRERLALHRDHKGCASCHAGIDPWGLPLEKFDAGGLFRAEHQEASARLPDGTEVADYAALRAYLAGPRMDRVAFSVLKHLATYGTGRTLTYNELVFLEEKGLTLRRNGYRMQDMIRFVITSEIFLTK